MSYSMSPPAQKPAPFQAPYQAAGSPTNQSPYAPPPAKRQRLSPDARSPPNGSPMYANTPNGLPTAGYGNPYAPPAVRSPYSPQSFAGSPTGSFNTPQPYQQQQMPWSVQPPAQRSGQMSPPSSISSRDMPPPPRPSQKQEEKEERIDVSDIGDSLFGSGISLKDEENYLHSMWSNRHASDSFATNQSTSFGSSTMSPNNSFNMLTQGTSFGSQGAQDAFGGTIGRPLSQEDIENVAKGKRELAARRKAEQDQHHLNNQFLMGNCLRNRMHKLAMENAVRLDVQGVYLKNQDDEPEKTQVMVNGAGTEGVAEVKAKPASLIEPGVAYEHILSLVSLAAGERLRGLVDDAHGLARARRYGDHGRVVPPEFADIAVGDGEKARENVVPQSITGTQWDKAGDTAMEDAEATPQVNGDSGTPQAVQTVSFQGRLNARLQELAERDRLAEKERQKKREARKRKAEATAGDETTPTETPADTPSAGGVSEIAPAKMSKKEMNKKQKDAQSAEAQSVTQSNQTAALAAGLGGKMSRYSWMSGGATNTPVNRFARTATGSGTSTPKPQSTPKPAAAAKEDVKVPKWGEWREDGMDGRGIQLRDWVFVLERDGHNKKALQKAVNKLS